MRIDTWFKSDIGRVRRSNQDTVGCFPELALFVVADGMGGRAQGEVASRMAVETFRELLENTPVAGNDAQPKDSTFWRSLLGRRSQGESAGDLAVLRSTAEAANRKIFEAGRRSAEISEVAAPSMGTTVVALRCDLVRRQASWVHVGDSRLYRMRGGQLRLMTADHTVFGEAFRQQSEVPTDLRHTNQLVQALGIDLRVEVAGSSAALEPDDLFLLCSDGISGMVPATTILADLSRPVTLAERGQLLLQHALDAGGRDNASLLLVHVLDP
ncbi:MAG: serine/threonine-protein phosphatase [Deltaproteobacteria bacterium]|nr:serine/threonine-protein phosphatase [Deltaproteobacteria bacterium]